MSVLGKGQTGGGAPGSGEAPVRREGRDGQIGHAPFGQVRQGVSPLADRWELEPATRRPAFTFRPYKPVYFMPVVHSALDKIRAPPPTTEPGIIDLSSAKDDEKRIFFHIPYHPDNPPSSAIQRAWKSKVSQPPFCRRLKTLRNHAGHQLNLDRLTVAYH